MTVSPLAGKPAEAAMLEHFVFGRSNAEIIRRMPCSVLLVKKEPGPVK